MKHAHHSLRTSHDAGRHWVNDTHSGLNRTAVSRIFEPKTAGDVVQAVRRCRMENSPLAISGGRHAMGGQQFLRGGAVLDTRGLKSH